MLSYMKNRITIAGGNPFVRSLDNKLTDPNIHTSEMVEPSLGKSRSDHLTKYIQAFHFEMRRPAAILAMINGGHNEAFKKVLSGA